MGFVLFRRVLRSLVGEDCFVDQPGGRDLGYGNRGSQSRVYVDRGWVVSFRQLKNAGKGAAATPINVVETDVTMSTCRPVVQVGGGVGARCDAQTDNAIVAVCLVRTEGEQSQVRQLWVRREKRVDCKKRANGQEKQS